MEAAVLVWFRRFTLAAGLLLAMAAAGSSGPDLVAQGVSTWNALNGWAQSDGPAATRAAFIFTGGPVRPED